MGRGGGQNVLYKPHYLQERGLANALIDETDDYQLGKATSYIGEIRIQPILNRDSQYLLSQEKSVDASGFKFTLNTSDGSVKIAGAEFNATLLAGRLKKFSTDNKLFMTISSIDGSTRLAFLDDQQQIKLVKLNSWEKATEQLINNHENPAIIMPHISANALGVLLNKVEF